MRLALVFVLALTAPARAEEKNEWITHFVLAAQLDHGQLHGGELGASIGYHGVSIGAELEGKQLSRPLDPSRHFGLGAGFSLTVSLFGLLINDGDHRVEHWFDIGGEIGTGAGYSQPETFGHGWVGGWMQIGLGPGRSYPVLFLDVRRDMQHSTWDDQTIVSIGLGWVARGRHALGDIRD